MKLIKVGDKLFELNDDRLSPMTYSKLKEMGYTSEDWKDWDQEHANKVVAQGRQEENKKQSSTTESQNKTQQTQQHIDLGIQAVNNAESAEAIKTSINRVLQDVEDALLKCRKHKKSENFNTCYNEAQGALQLINSAELQLQKAVDTSYAKQQKAEEEKAGDDLDNATHAYEAIIEKGQKLAEQFGHTRRDSQLFSPDSYHWKEHPEDYEKFMRSGGEELGQQAQSAKAYKQEMFNRWHEYNSYNITAIRRVKWALKGLGEYKAKFQKLIADTQGKQDKQRTTKRQSTQNDNIANSINELKYFSEDQPNNILTFDTDWEMDTDDEEDKYSCVADLANRLIKHGKLKLENIKNAYFEDGLARFKFKNGESVVYTVEFDDYGTPRYYRTRGKDGSGSKWGPDATIPY